MPILETDIKLKASEKMTDAADGGGKMTTHEIVSGEVNNVFPDISRLDRTTGRANLRKVYLHVDTDNTDTYRGAHMIVSKNPADPRVELVLFNTESDTDQRVDAQARIENYLVKSVATGWQVFGDHYAGQLSLNVLQQISDRLPAVGETYVLSATGKEQYVRVKDVGYELREFTGQSNGGIITYRRRVVTLALFQPLKYDLTGQEPDYFWTYSPVTKILYTSVADAARYFGTVDVTETAEAGQKTIQCDTIYRRVVPTTEDELPFVDARAMPDSLVHIAAGGPLIVTNDYHVVGGGHKDFAATTTWYFGRPIEPGSLKVDICYSDYGGASSPRFTFNDNGVGGLIPADGSIGVFSSAEVNYELGRVVLRLTQGMASAYGDDHVRLTAVPAAIVAMARDTESVAITQGNRGFVFVHTLTPVPAPGALTIAYRALNRWYLLRDNGLGKIVGLENEADGIGTLNYETGTSNITLAALPDVGSRLIYMWGTSQSTRNLANGNALTTQYEIIKQTGGPIEPGSFSIGYIQRTTGAGEITRTITDNGTGGLTGAGTGSVNYASGEIRWVPQYMPKCGSSVTYTHDQLPVVTASGSPSEVGGYITVDMGEAVKARSVYVDLPVTAGGNQGLLRLRDNGSGALHIWQAVGIQTTTVAVGTIDNATGVAVIDATIPCTIYTQDATAFFRTWVETASETAYDPSRAVNWGYVPAAGTGVAGGAPEPLPALLVNLTRGRGVTVVPNSLVLSQGVESESAYSYGGQGSFDRRFYDRAGQLVRRLDITSGAAENCGTINYETGIATVTSWPDFDNASNQITVMACQGYIGETGTVESTFFIPAPALRASSYQARVITVGGAQSLATSDGAGNIAGGVVTGSIHYDNGVVHQTYSSPVLPSEQYYNAVGVRYVPLDPDLLGLDPIRLPQDGRVPVFRPGDVCVLMHTDDETLPAPLTAGQVVQLSRYPISRLELLDDAGVVVPKNRYTVDFNSAEITFADPLDLTGFQQPLVARNRIEDMRIVSEAQINGLVTVLESLSRDFPAGSLLASAVAYGDLYGHTEFEFTQQTWTNVWSNSRIGNDSVAKYNDTLYPIEVQNNGCIRERWAIVFTSSTNFQVIGEFSGVVALGNTSADCSPMNPLIGQPYWTLRCAGWGGGQVPNNAFRFNTVGATGPGWAIRATGSGPATETNDQGELEARGDRDA